MSDKSPGVAAQIPLNLRFQPEQRFATFVTPTGATALAVVQDALVQPTVCLLQGAADTGKTHLLLAACHGARQLSKRVAYVALNAVGGHAEHALAAAEDAQLIAIDELGSLADDSNGQVALFHLLNHARARGASVLLASQRSPAELGIGLPDLVSRLNAAVRVPLHMLDDEGRREVLRLRAQSQGLEFDEAALDWLLTRADRRLTVLMGLWRQLDHASSVHKKKLTLPFVRETIGDQLR